jgi:hypothetical protein
MSKCTSYRKYGMWRKFSPVHTPYPTANYSVCMVYLARSATQISCYHPATPKGARRMGHAGYRSQMQETCVQPPLDVKYERRLYDRGPGAQLKPYRLLDKPTTSLSFSAKIAHFRQYATDMAYVAPGSERIGENVQTPPI